MARILGVFADNAGAIRGELTANDETARENPGAILIRHSGDGARAYIYGYNNLGSDMIQSTMYRLMGSSTMSTQPSFVALPTMATQVVVGVSQVAVTDGYWGWFLVAGKAEAVQNTWGLGITAGYGIMSEMGKLNDTNAVYGESATDRDLAVACETVAVGVYPCDMYLVGREARAINGS